MAKNLISLGTLGAIGCNFSGGAEGMKVTKGSLVIMKGVRTTPGQIYYLDGSVITGSVAVSDAS